MGRFSLAAAAVLLTLAAVGRAADTAPDLGTKEKAVRALHAALRADDKATFRKCVTARILERHEQDFEQWYKVWRGEAAARPVEKWLEAGPRMAPDNGQWKLDEN